MVLFYLVLLETIYSKLLVIIVNCYQEEIIIKIKILESTIE